MRGGSSKQGGNGEDRNIDTDLDSLAAAWGEINFKWCNQSFLKFLPGWKRKRTNIYTECFPNFKKD